mgnify:CR=1 FL=1
MSSTAPERSQPRTGVVTRPGRVLSAGHAYLVVDGLVLEGQYFRGKHRAMLANLAMVLAKTDLAVASRYAELVSDAALREVRSALIRSDAFVYAFLRPGLRVRQERFSRKTGPSSSPSSG